MPHNSSSNFGSVRTTRFLSVNPPIRRFIDQHRSFFNSLRLPLMLVDIEKTILFTNTCFSETTGYSSSELEGKPWSNFVPSQTLGKLLKFYNIRKRYPDKAPSSYDVVLELKNGDQRDFILTVSSFFDNKLFLLTFTDVTSSKNYKLELARTSEQYHKLIETSPDGFLQLDKDLNVVLVNNFVTRFFSHLRGDVDLIGKNILFLCPEDQRDSISQAIDSARRDGSFRNLELSVYDEARGTTYFFEVNISVVYEDNDPLYYILVIRDITERKVLEQKLKEYASQLEHLVDEKARKLLAQERSVMLGRLAASISHNINNPLQFVIGNAELLVKMLDNSSIEPSLVKSLAQSLLSGCYRIVEVSDKLRRASRRGPISVFDLAIPIEVAISVTKGQWKKKCSQVKVRYLTDDVIKIKGDESDIAHVFMNLIINSVQAIEERGDIEIRVSKFSSKKVLIEFEDTGSGIPPEIADKIGKETVTTKPPDIGTGLGLLWIYDTIQQHYGTIDFKTEIGKGTTFKILLPIVQDEKKQDH